MPSAITSKLQLFPLISLFFLSFKKMTSAVCCSFHKFPLNCLSCSTAAENSSKNDSFIRKEKQTSAPEKWQRAMADCLLPEGFWFSIRCLCTQQQSIYQSLMMLMLQVQIRNTCKAFIYSYSNCQLVNPQYTIYKASDVKPFMLCAIIKLSSLMPLL